MKRAGIPGPSICWKQNPIQRFWTWLFPAAVPSCAKERKEAISAMSRERKSCCSYCRNSSSSGKYCMGILPGIWNASQRAPPWTFIFLSKRICIWCWCTYGVRPPPFVIFLSTWKKWSNYWEICSFFLLWKRIKGFYYGFFRKEIIRRKRFLILTAWKIRWILFWISAPGPDTRPSLCACTGKKQLGMRFLIPTSSCMIPITKKAHCCPSIPRLPESLKKRASALTIPPLSSGCRPQPCPAGCPWSRRCIRETGIYFLRNCCIAAGTVPLSRACIMPERLNSIFPLYWFIWNI